VGPTRCVAHAASGSSTTNRVPATVGSTLITPRLDAQVELERGPLLGVGAHDRHRGPDDALEARDPIVGTAPAKLRDPIDP
jgi:hypothetical protein